MNRILWQRTLTQLRGQLDESSDSDLLERFVKQRDGDAFGLLLQRHGPMVWAVCRRILSTEADAEDAFQATFVVLVRKAGQLRDRRALANWLYGVAHTTALKARSMTGKRQAKEQHAAKPEGDETPTTPDWLPLLDDELSRLPAIYRTVLVLCDLEGLSHKDAAERLNCPIGTVSARLARGRRMLADRLRHRGLTLSVAALTATLTHNAMQAIVPPSLIALTQVAANGGTPSAAVANLTDKVIQAMFIKKIMTLTLAATVIVATTFGFLPSQESVQAQTPAIVERVERDVNQKRLEGTWIPDQLVTANGVTNYPLRGRVLHFERGIFVRMEGNHAVAMGRYELADGLLKVTVEENNAWDLEAGVSKKSLQYSFHIEGDLLTLCYAVDGKNKAGDLAPGEGRQVTVYKRRIDGSKPVSTSEYKIPLRPAPSLGSVGTSVPSTPPSGLPMVGPYPTAPTPTTGDTTTPSVPSTLGIPSMGAANPLNPVGGSARPPSTSITPDRSRLEKLEQELLELRKKIDAELAKTKAGQ